MNHHSLNSIIIPWVTVRTRTIRTRTVCTNRLTELPRQNKKRWNDHTIDNNIRGSIDKTIHSIKKWMNESIFIERICVEVRANAIYYYIYNTMPNLTSRDRRTLYTISRAGYGHCVLLYFPQRIHPAKSFTTNIPLSRLFVYNRGSFNTWKLPFGFGGGTDISVVRRKFPFGFGVINGVPVLFETQQE